jgi:alpha-galactosidase
MMGFSLFHALTAAVFAVGIHAVDNGLARTPQMGWNNWNAFGCDVSESLLLETAHYIVLDDCWSSERNAAGELEHDPVRFPNGMKYVADKLHAMDLGFGMYSDAGVLTCAGYR